MTMYYLYRKFHRIAHKFIPERRFPEAMVSYGGSGWWMLTDEAVKYILKYADERTDVVSFFRYTEAPDEMFFHTILLNSPLAKNVNGYSSYDVLMQKWKKILDGCPDKISRYEKGNEIRKDHESFNLRYIDWDPRRERPAILDESDYKSLSKSECFFARKMHPERSKKLLDMIDHKLLAT
jgi:hypothetical protein